MNSLVQLGVIDELYCGENFSYIVNDEKLYMPTEHKVLINQSECNFVKCMTTRFNGKLQLYYLISGFKSLSNLAGSIDAENAVKITANILKEIIAVKNNGFLSCQSIELSFEHIYVDLSDYNVSLLYIPISKRIHEDIYAFEYELRKKLAELINNNTSIPNNTTMQLASDLTDYSVTIENIYRKIAAHTKSTTKPPFDPPNPNNKMQITAINSPVPLVIDIVKDEFILGRKSDVVDGAISFSKKVGRIHCKICKQGEKYYIYDLQSTNKTHVNRVTIQPDQPYPVKDGDIIRIADVEFKVTIC